ncbi:hypothetical protein [Treponema parvum]|uniref:hypothetical protein n=1 Tax=Treponema parvum TaxID=138851 RepID=UPI001AEBCC18|nr:hypothetical protein [Treponema parvum]QTQ15737.1 hypothetical protein HXT04_02915 [Treponema parvum]
MGKIITKEWIRITYNENTTTKVPEMYNQAKYEEILRSKTEKMALLFLCRPSAMLGHTAPSPPELLPYKKFFGELYSVWTKPGCSLQKLPAFIKTAGSFGKRKTFCHVMNSIDP